ncbi:hypothetical protein Trydic_g10428 [Trypoxylus dichotomus]
MKIQYTKEEEQDLHGYCDADWGNDLDNRRSVSGYVFISQGGPIAWCTKRQPTVALSTAEAEYVSISVATQQASWLRNIHQEVHRTNLPAVTIYCDNKSAVDLTTTNMYHSRTKHIDLKQHFIREKVDESAINVKYVKTEEMFADVLMKGLANAKHFMYK